MSTFVFFDLNTVNVQHIVRIFIENRYTEEARTVMILSDGEKLTDFYDKDEYNQLLIDIRKSPINSKEIQK